MEKREIGERNVVSIVNLSNLKSTVLVKYERYMHELDWESHLFPNLYAFSFMRTEYSGLLKERFIVLLGGSTATMTNGNNNSNNGNGNANIVCQG